MDRRTLRNRHKVMPMYSQTEKGLLYLVDFLLPSAPTTQWCLFGFPTFTIFLCVADWQFVGRYFVFIQKIPACINFFYNGCQNMHIYQVTVSFREEHSCLSDVIFLFYYLQILTTQDFYYSTVYRYCCHYFNAQKFPILANGII